MNKYKFGDWLRDKNSGDFWQVIDFYTNNWVRIRKVYDFNSKSYPSYWSSMTKTEKEIKEVDINMSSSLTRGVYEVGECVINKRTNQLHEITDKIQFRGEPFYIYVYILDGYGTCFANDLDNNFNKLDYSCPVVRLLYSKIVSKHDRSSK